MIKHINPQNILTSPFIAAKARVLSNTQNSDVVVLEQDGVTPIALDYVNYNFGSPILNSDCNIALEQQDADAIAYQEGIADTGTFNSESAPRNADGTYKSLVHRTTKNAFYNTYHNPTEIFGVEHIDFALSNTLRNIADQFRIFSLSPLQFGDKIEPKSVRFYDTLLDDNVTIFDDGFQNLVAGFNLFSKVQEVRTWPSGSNPQVILPGTTSYSCPSYDSVRITNPKDAYGDPGANVTFSVSASGYPLPIVLQWYTGSIGSGTPLVDGGRYSGSNAPTFHLANIGISDVGTTYYATAHNHASASATSSEAHVYLYPPKISLNPLPQANYTTSIFYDLIPTSQSFFTASFEVSASGGGNPLTYQWYLNGSPLSDNSRITGSHVLNNGSGSFLQINNLQVGDVGYYYVGVTDDGGTSMSTSASLIVWDNTLSRSMADTMSYGTPLRFGSTNTLFPYAEGSVPTFGATLLSGQILNNVFVTQQNDTASVSTAFDSGLLFDSLIPIYGGNETASVSTAFDSGLLFNVLVPIYGGNETASVLTGFDQGALVTVIGAVINISDTPTTFGVSLLTGSVI
jgi:hypothetical protein